MLLLAIVSAWADGAYPHGFPDRVDGSVDVPTDAIIPYDAFYCGLECFRFYAADSGLEVPYEQDGRGFVPLEPLAPFTRYVIEEIYGSGTNDTVTFTTGEGPSDVLPPIIEGVRQGPLVVVSSPHYPTEGDIPVYAAVHLPRVDAWSMVMVREEEGTPVEIEWSWDREVDLGDSGSTVEVESHVPPAVGEAFCFYAMVRTATWEYFVSDSTCWVLLPPQESAGYGVPPSPEPKGCGHHGLPLGACPAAALAALATRRIRRRGRPDGV